MKTKEEIRKEINEHLDDVQFLSPNEPITPQGIQRVLDKMSESTKDMESFIDFSGKTITMWNPNMVYKKDDIVLYFKSETKQKHPDVDKREFAFILISLQSDNTTTPNYDLVNGVPDFKKSGWNLLNPMSYLLQDLIEMKKIVKEAFETILETHVKEEHGLVNAQDIESNLLRKDYTNLTTPWRVGEYALCRSEQETSDGWTRRKLSSNGIMEYQIKYAFDETANQKIRINDRKYYYEKSPIFDESDQTIFGQKYIEDDMFSVNVNERVAVKENGTQQVVFTSFNNLRYGTNIFNKRINFSMPFANDEYMVFFDTYGNGEFVFGYDRHDLHERKEPTYDAIVSMPMLLNKTTTGFDIVLPIHTYFNSIKKYNIGVPWNNVFTLQAIGRYR